MQSGTFFTNPFPPDFTLQLSSELSGSSNLYLRRKILLSITNLALTIAYLSILAFTSLKSPFLHLASMLRGNYGQFIVFIVAIEIVFAILKFPLDYYADFVLEHRFNLSRQSFAAWIVKRLKGTLVGSVAGLLLLSVFYFLLVAFPRAWWLLFAAFFFLFQVVIAQLFPTVILPLFYKLKPLSDETLYGRLESLVVRFGYRMSGVFSFDLGKETRKANAALTGLGRSRKIIISDTLLENFTADEIEVVAAHELGHLVRHHMLKGILVSGMVSVIGFFVMARLYLLYTAALGVPQYDLSALLFLSLVMTLLGVLAIPLGNFYSRRIEHEADDFALLTTGMRDEFASSMHKLGKLNLTPEDPPAWIEKIFFSHPSIAARIRAAEESR